MGEREEVKVYGTWASPFSKRVELALKIKGIPYEYIEENLSNKSPSLLKYNPVHKKIPVLVHMGKPIAESLVIIEYIDETWNTSNISLFPKDPYHRAMARFWAKFVDEKILETSRRSNKAKDEQERNKAIEELEEHLKLLEKELKGKDFFGGETIGYLDIVVFFMAYRFLLMKQVTQMEVLSEEKFPVLYKWVEKLLDMDVVKESLPPKEKHVAHIKARFQAAKSAPK